MADFLRVNRNKIMSGNQPVHLKGVNLGGWLMMEAYFMHAPNIAEQVFKKDFEKRLGTEALHELENKFRDYFIRKEDIRMIAEMGFNCVRLPFNCRLIEKNPFEYDLDGVAYLDRAIRWAQQNGLKVILDLHAAPGAQNHDWHSDSLGKAGLWSSRSNQERVFALWKFIAERYKNNGTIAGYDLLNESVIDNTEQLNCFYQELIKAVRMVDRNHILFVEGNRWAIDLDCLRDFDDDNWAYSIHFYHPIEFTFNLTQELKYPLRSEHGGFDKSTLRGMTAAYEKFSKKRPVFVGEFGVHSRQGIYGEDLWLIDLLDCFEEADFHWTYWTYKAVKNYMFPDGIFSYFPNDPWVHRQGPKSGWDTWADCWPTMKTKMIRSWQTKNFKANESVAGVLKKYL
ncbi:MAG: glycoside hydrolase family 5 protein [Candidatus Omnitrophota bacterium]